MGIVFGRQEERHERNYGDNHLIRPSNQRFSPGKDSYPFPVPSSSSTSSSMVETNLSSLSEKKPPISAAPSTRSPEKPHESWSSFTVSPAPYHPSSGASQSPRVPPWKTSRSPLPSSRFAADTGDRMKSSSATVFSETKRPISTEPSKRFLEKPGETTTPSNFSPSPHLSARASSPSPLPLKASSNSKVSSGLSPSSKASPPPSPFKFSEPDERLSEPLKIEQRSRYEIPKDLKELIEKDKVPPVLRTPLSPSTYAEYFATLLYAEDFYLEKWSNYLLSEVTLDLRHDVVCQIQDSRIGKKSIINPNADRKDVVAFEIDSVPEKRPYLLSRDFVCVQPSGEKAGPFKGILFRVVKSTTVLAEFKDDFHKQHSPTKKYDVSFSFNRVCLKRFHQAVSAASDPLLCKILFPDPSFKSSSLNLPSSDVQPRRISSHAQLHVVNQILNLKGPLPYLIEGPLSETREGTLSGTGAIIRNAVLQIYRTCAHCRILVCAPRNRTCDALMKKWMLEIPKSELFRANAAFREFHLVPDDIISACLYEGECFTCPPLSELQQFKVITSTFVSSFRLHAAGIEADHFTHIFLVDASSATEPETIVALTNLVSNKTAIVITGSSYDIPVWVRSDIARRNGLKKSLFQRLLQVEPYSRKDPMFITHIT